MKKFLTLVIAVLGMANGIFSQNRSINFIEGKSFAELKELAKKENKMIFIDFYTDWCGPCKMMDKKIYPNDSVADFYNSHFVNMKVDAEKGEGVKLAKQYEIGAYPTFLFVSSDGSMIHRGCKASKTGKDFINLGQNALNPEKQFSKLLKSIEVRDEISLSKLVAILNSACLPVRETISGYLSAQKDADLFSKSNWELIRKYVANIDSREFKFLVKNQKKFSELYGDSLVKHKILSAYVDRVWDLATDTISQGMKDEKFSRIKADVKISSLPYADQILAESEMNFYNKTENWMKLSEVGTSGVVEKYYWNRGPSLDHIARVFSEHISDTAVLRKAVIWAKHSVELNDNPYNNGTYAELLSKVGEIDKAIEVYKHAIELANKVIQSQEVLKKYEDALEKLKQSK